MHNVVNFGAVTLTADCTSTSVSVVVSDYTLLPAAPFMGVMYPATYSSATNAAENSVAEIVEVTVAGSDTLSITRAQEGTTAHGFVIGDNLIAPITAQVITEIQDTVSSNTLSLAAVTSSDSINTASNTANSNSNSANSGYISTININVTSVGSQLASIMLGGYLPKTYTGIISGGRGAYNLTSIIPGYTDGRPFLMTVYPADPGTSIDTIEYFTDSGGNTQVWIDGTGSSNALVTMVTWG